MKGTEIKGVPAVGVTVNVEGQFQIGGKAVATGNMIRPFVIVDAPDVTWIEKEFVADEGFTEKVKV